MPEKTKRSKRAATPAPKMPPAPAAGKTELSDEELGRVSGGSAFSLDPKVEGLRMPTAKHLNVPKLDSTLP